MCNLSNTCHQLKTSKLNLDNLAAKEWYFHAVLTAEAGIKSCKTVGIMGPKIDPAMAEGCPLKTGWFDERDDICCARAPSPKAWEKRPGCGAGMVEVDLPLSMVRYSG